MPFSQKFQSVFPNFADLGESIHLIMGDNTWSFRVEVLIQLHPKRAKLT